MGVFPGLFLADKRVELLGLGFKNSYREAAFIQQEVINIALCRLLEVVAEAFEGLLFELDGASSAMLAGPVSSSKKRQRDLRRRSLIRILTLASFGIRGYLFSA